jgi:hypothetical protein
MIYGWNRAKLWMEFRPPSFGRERRRFFEVKVFFLVIASYAKIDYCMTQPPYNVPGGRIMK